jgi:hypothetical protein
MLETTAQLIVEEQPMEGHLEGGPIQLIPISAPFTLPSAEEGGIEVEDSKSEEPQLEVEAPADGSVDLIKEINLSNRLVGADDFDPQQDALRDKIESITVSEDDGDDKDKLEADENDAKKGKKSDAWDWETKGATGFLAWVKNKINTVPKHSGYDTAGLERAASYLERLDNEISKAMRLDLEGELDANQIEHVRSQIEKGLDMLYDRVDKVKDSKKKAKKGKKRAEVQSTLIVKEAQKITGVQGIYVTVPLLISRVARVCINGMVFAGHDIEDLYARQVKKYKLSDREQAETMQLLADMGYALRQDRGFMPDDDLEVEDGMDWNQNFKG